MKISAKTEYTVFFTIFIFKLMHERYMKQYRLSDTHKLKLEPVSCLIWVELKILSFYRKIWVIESLYFGLFFFQCLLHEQPWCQTAKIYGKINIIPKIMIMVQLLTWLDRNNKRTNKQTNKQINKQRQQKHVKVSQFWK